MGSSACAKLFGHPAIVEREGANHATAVGRAGSILPNVVDAGNRRAQDHGLTKPFDVAREMVRVTRPGGRIVMGNWIPNDPTLVAQILKISSAYSPPPPEGFISPMTWGIEAHVIERFASAGIPQDNVSFVRDTCTFNFPEAPSALVDAFRRYYGPTMNAFETAEKNGRADDLRKELNALFESQNTSPRKDATSIPATFLRVTVAV